MTWSVELLENLESSVCKSSNARARAIDTALWEQVARLLGEDNRGAGAMHLGIRVGALARGANYPYRPQHLEP